MRRMPLNLKGKGVSKTAAAAAAAAEVREKSSVWSGAEKRREGEEPRSVLDQRRSPSDGDSGEGSNDVAAVSGNSLQKWQETTSSAGGGGGGGGGRKEDWASELQPIPLEIGLMGGGGGGSGERCLGGEDWESMLTEEAAPAPVGALPGQDQTFLRWIMGDVDQHPQMLPQSVAADTELAATGGGGFGFVDQGFGLEHLGGIGIGDGAPLSSSGVGVGVGFPLGGDGGDGGGGGGGNRILPIPSSSPLPTVKNHVFGNTPSPLFASPPPTISAATNFSFPPMFLPDPVEEKPQLFSPTHHLLNPQQTQVSQNSSFFLPLNAYSQSDHHHHQQLLPQSKFMSSMTDPSYPTGPKVPFSNPGQDLFLRRHQQQHQHQPQQQQTFEAYQRPVKLKIGGHDASTAAAAAVHHQQQHHHHHQQQQQQQQQVIADQLLKAAELVDSGNSVNAREILARLNHQLSPHGKPLIRTALYFKEALDAIAGSSNPSVPLASSPPAHYQRKTPVTPLDVALKLNAYKNFSEISPVVQFTNFTRIQVLLEELRDCDHIHIVDFDISFGGQWASFMQELSQRRCSAAEAAPSLKITAFVVPSSYHNLELVLTRDNLSHFARDLNIPFELNILNIDSFDPSVVLNMSSGYNEAIAVNIPVGPSFASFSTILRRVKQLSPKIVVSVDHNCDRSDLSFSQHFLKALHSYTVLLESIDAVGTNMEVSNKIERYLVQPRIEHIVSGRYNAAEKVLPWRTLFATAGFVPLPFSNFTETQADCVLKRYQLSGFHVEKRQSSLLLFWQREELLSVSAWKC